MKKIYLMGFLGFFALTNMGNPAIAETIIQTETMSFEKCKEVIDVSAENLAAPLNIKTDQEKLRVAEFKLADGILLISCNGENNQIVVSSK